MSESSRLSDPQRKSRRGRAGKVAVVLLALAVAGGAAWHARGRGSRAWVTHRYFGGAVPFAKRPGVSNTRPGHFDGSVPLDGFVAADVELPNNGYVVDAKTVTPQSVRLFRTADKHEVAAVVNTSGGGDAIVLRPRDRREPNTQYTFEVNGGGRDTAGAAFRYFSSNFTTAAGAEVVELPVAFDK